MPYPSKTDREKILAAAMKLIMSEGINGLSLRSVAASLGLAPNAIYRYFADRAALEAALAEESLRRLEQVLRKAAGRRSPEDAVRRVSMAYVRFAREEPQLFALAMMPCTVDPPSGGVHEELWQFVLEQVARIYGAERAPEAAVTLWAFLQGITALEAARVFGARKPTSSFDFGLSMWIKAAKS